MEGSKKSKLDEGDFPSKEDLRLLLDSPPKPQLLDLLAKLHFKKIPFQEIEEGAVIYDKTTGKSRGYGFIAYENMESTQRALRAPSKLIDGRLAVSNLACEGLSGASSSPHLFLRKLYIGNLSPEVTSEILLNLFGMHGEIEEGSVAYD